MQGKHQWGPFNGRHLAVIVVVVVAGLVVATPGIGLADGGSSAGKVMIKDGTTSSLAKVSPNGSLQVGDGQGPLTVDGTVTVETPPPITNGGGASYVIGDGEAT